MVIKQSYYYYIYYHIESFRNISWTEYISAQV